MESLKLFFTTPLGLTALGVAFLMFAKSWFDKRRGNTEDGSKMKSSIYYQSAYLFLRGNAQPAVIYTHILGEDFEVDGTYVQFNLSAKSVQVALGVNDHFVFSGTSKLHESTDVSWVRLWVLGVLVYEEFVYELDFSDSNSFTGHLKDGSPVLVVHGDDVSIVVEEIDSP